MRKALVLLSSWSLITVYAQRIEGPIDVSIVQWQPVAAGMWAVTAQKLPGRREPNSAVAPVPKESSACPYPSLLFLRSHAAVKLGQPGCQFQTYRLSKDQYHIVARCRTLEGKDHYETTTLIVSNEGKAFSSATTWVDQTGSVTERIEGVWSAACK